MEIVHEYGNVIAERYRVIDILGQGGSGTTYIVQHLETNENLALKSLLLNWVNDWKVVELFEREAKILSQLNHPAIPFYREYFYIDTPSNRSFYIAQQIAPGKSLAAMVEGGWRTEELEIQDIAIQVLEILQYLHSCTPPVIHRDIKPQNIIRSDDGKIYLVDFGAVKQTYHDTFMRGSTVVGTYGYMAPEQFRSIAVPATDLYGLAATLLYLLTHRSPADLPSDGLKIDVRSCVQVSEHFAAWLEKMLEPDLEERFTSAAEAIEALITKRKIQTPKKATKPKTKLKLVIAIASVVVAASSISLINYYQLEILSTLGFKDFINRIPLSRAATDGDEKLIKQLLADGANINSTDNDHRTPLLNVIYSELIERNSDVSPRHKDGKTPLHTQRYEAIVKLLIEKGADVNAKDGNGDTPLHLVVSHDFNQKEIQELLVAGANINAKNSNGDTPLHLCIDDGIVELLIHNGADVKAVNNQGLTPVERRKQIQAQ